MVVLKKKIGKEELVSLSTFSSIYAIFDSFPYLKLGDKGKVSITLNGEKYPNIRVKRFENYGDKALIDYYNKPLSGYKVKQVFTNKPEGLVINTIITNITSSKKKIKFYLNLEILGEGFLDEIRDAYIFEDKGDKYIIGVKSKIKNIKVVNKTKIPCNEKYKDIDIEGELELDIGEKENISIIISKDIDNYDKLYLEIPQEEYIIQYNKLLVAKDKSIENLYSLSYRLLSNTTMSDPLWELMRLLAINDGEGIEKNLELLKKALSCKERISDLSLEKVSLLKIISQELNKRGIKINFISQKRMKSLIRTKNIGALHLLSENKLGSSIYHTIALSYDLLNKKNYEESYKLLLYFSNTVYDSLLLSPPKVKEEDILEQLILFLITSNNLFFNIRKASKGVVIETYLPENYINIEHRRLSIFYGIGSISISKALHGFVANISLTLHNPLSFIALEVNHQGKIYKRRINLRYKTGEYHFKDILLV